MRFEHWIYQIPLRLRSLFRRRQVEQDLEEELRFHQEARAAMEINAGKTPEEAHYSALRAMHGVEQQKEECRDARGVNRLENLAQDLRYAWHGLVKNPGFAVVAVSTLALGIGANTAIFSVVNAALLRPLPYPRPDRLVLLFEKSERPNVVSFPNFMDWERESHGFDAMAAGRQNSFNLSGSGAFQPERIQGGAFSWTLFKTLAVQPVLGRPFSANDDRPDAPPVAIVSYGLWQRRFAGASDILHRQIRLDGVSCDIAGVMPQGFGYPTREIEVWRPVQQIFGNELVRNRSWHHLYVVARIREGVTIAQATAEIDGIQQRIHNENPSEISGRGAVSIPLRDITTVQSRTSLYVLLGAVGCLLLIACANISNLLLARGSQRSREFSLRAALGASRSRLVQQLLTESLLLSLLGCCTGLLMAHGLIAALGSHAAALIQADDIDTSAAVRIDGGVLAFTAIVSLLTGIAAGLLPAQRATKGDLAGSLKEGGRAATAGHRQQRVRGILICAEFAFSLVLVITACLMIRSFAELRRVHSGVRAENLLTAAVSLPDSRYNTRALASRFLQNLLDRLGTLPGVQAAGLVNCAPVTGYCGDNSFAIEGRPLPPGEFNNALDFAASADYFNIVGIPLLEGRAFTPRDGRGFDENHWHESALLISESMARKFWPRGGALGQRVYFGDVKSPRYQIVGIVGDVLIGLDDHPRPTMYRPMLEGGHTDFYAVLRTNGDPAALASSVRRAISSIDADIPAFKIRTMTEILGQSGEHREFAAALLGGFAGLAVLLAAVGLYGVLSYLIAQRTPEIGIRMALGASRAGVCRLLLAQGLRPALLGVLIGGAAAAALGQTIKALLFGVQANDPAILVSAPLGLLCVAALACLVPVLRALRVDPMTALRSE